MTAMPYEAPDDEPESSVHPSPRPTPAPATLDSLRAAGSGQRAAGSGQRAAGSGQRAVLIAVRSAGALHRLLDVLPVFEGDSRITTRFTLVPGSHFDVDALAALDRS